MLFDLDALDLLNHTIGENINCIFIFYVEACKGTSTHHTTVVQSIKLESRHVRDVSQAHVGRLYVSGSSVVNKVKLECMSIQSGCS